MHFETIRDYPQSPPRDMPDAGRSLRSNTLVSANRLNEKNPVGSRNSKHLPLAASTSGNTVTSRNPPISTMAPILPSNNSANNRPNNNSSSNIGASASNSDNVGIELDLTGLSKENKKLAQIIVDAVASHMREQFSKEREVYEARISNMEKEIQVLRDRHDDLENYGRRNTIVISGPSLPNATTNENCIDTATQIILEKLELPNFARTDIDVAHRLGKPRPGTPDKRSIIVKLCRRENKQIIFQACRIKKPQNIFFSESVSKTRSTILYILRKARRDFPGKFGMCKTEDGNVRVMLPTPDDPTRFTRETVNTRSDLDKLLRTRINRDSSRFEARWES